MTTAKAADGRGNISFEPSPLAACTVHTSPTRLGGYSACVLSRSSLTIFFLDTMGNHCDYHVILLNILYQSFVFCAPSPYDFRYAMARLRNSFLAPATVYQRNSWCAILAESLTTTGKLDAWGEKNAKQEKADTAIFFTFRSWNVPKEWRIEYNRSNTIRSKEDCTTCNLFFI